MKAKPVAKTKLPSRRASHVWLIVSMIAAVAIVGSLNGIVFWQYEMLGARAKNLVRFDLTSRREYSLSPQTIAVLSDLNEPRRVVTLMSRDEPGRARVRDLIDEYARRSPFLSVSHLDPRTDDAAADALRQQVASGFAENLQPVRDTAATGADATLKLAQAVEAYRAITAQIAEEANVPNMDVEAIHRNAREAFTRISESAEALQALEGETLPAYTDTIAGARQSVELALGGILPEDARSLEILRRRLGDQPDTQERVFEAIEMLRTEVVPTANRTLDINRQIAVPGDRYERVRRTLLTGEWVVVLDGNRSRVLPIAGMFRRQVDAAGTAGPTDALFLGEERLTGALVSLTLEQPPLVVFVRGDFGRPLTGPAGPGLYEHVAQRLEALDIEVQAWNPIPPTGQRGLPPPQGLPGQKVVWVQMPFRTPTDAQPETLDVEPRRRVAGFLRDRLEAGDAVLVMLNFDPTYAPDRLEAVRASAAGEGDAEPAAPPLLVGPLTALLSEYGLTPQSHQRLAQQLSNEQGDWEKTDRFGFSQPVAEHPVARAAQGLTTRFQLPMPIELDASRGAEVAALVEVAGPRVWPFTPPPNMPQGRVPAFDAEASKPSFTIAAAADTGTTRLVVFGDPLFADDRVTTFGRHPELGAGPGLADRPGGVAAFPGNAELFVNSVFWLADLEGLIAASPRTQDTPRIRELTDGQQTTYRLLLAIGLPAIVVVVGIAVGLRRIRA